jgi:uncharacterized protein YkuJ
MHKGLVLLCLTLGMEAYGAEMFSATRKQYTFEKNGMVISFEEGDTIAFERDGTPYVARKWYQQVSTTFVPLPVSPAIEAYRQKLLGAMSRRRDEQAPDQINLPPIHSTPLETTSGDIPPIASYDTITSYEIDKKAEELLEFIKEKSNQ